MLPRDCGDTISWSAGCVEKALTAKQPFMQEQINVTNPRQFLDSILPYMVKQKMITEEKVNGKIVYQIRKD